MTDNMDSRHDLTKVERVAMECLSKMHGGLSDTEASRKAVRRAILLFRQLDSLREEFKAPLTPLRDLNLTERTRGCLERAGITTIEELVENTSLDLLRIDNLGKKSLGEVEETLAANGRSLKPYSMTRG